jgi:hypothetical protein
MKMDEMNSACSHACMQNVVQKTSGDKGIYGKIVLLVKWILEK